MTEVTVPNLGDAVVSATVSIWHYSPGDSIKKDDNLVELVTDKAVFNLPSPAAGTIKQLLFSEGETIKPGEVIAIID